MEKYFILVTSDGRFPKVTNDKKQLTKNISDTYIFTFGYDNPRIKKGYYQALYKVSLEVKELIIKDLTD
jgi:hypothetical protein